MVVPRLINGRTLRKQELELGPGVAGRGVSVKIDLGRDDMEPLTTVADIEKKLTKELSIHV